MRTLVSLMEDSATTYPSNNYIYQKEFGKYKGYTYTDVKNKVHEFAAGLMAMGLAPEDRVSLLAEGRLEWVISELGVLYNKAINVPLSIKLSPEEVLFRINHSGSKFLITTNRQIDKVWKMKDELTGLEKIIVLDKVGPEDEMLIGFNEVSETGKEFLKNNRKNLEERYASVGEDDYANICYTSGTTAAPKGIILSHRNYTANIEQSLGLIHIPSHYGTLLILPWDHAFAHTTGIYTLMKIGASLSCVDLGNSPMETLKNIPINITDIRPHFLLSVPALAKNFRKNIEKGIHAKGEKVEKLFNKALALAYKYNGIGWDKGKGAKILLKPLYKLYDIVLFKKIRENFGGNLKFFVGGGALLDIELQRFFYAIGIPMLQGYGLSEAAPVISANSPKSHKMGSSGKIANTLELKICDEDGNELPIGEKGEIVVKGENVMKGYWKNETATRETIKDGWLYTGDLGYVDKDNFLYVLGRFKSLLIADDGEKFSPEGIEEAFADQSPLIEQCMLYNNQRPYTICLLVPNAEALKRKAKDMHIDLSTPKGLTEILPVLQAEIDAYKKGGKYEDMFPQRWIPAAIAILPEGFTEENKMLNSTLKMVRPRITETYGALLESLYAPSAKEITNTQNIDNLKKRLL